MMNLLLRIFLLTVGWMTTSEAHPSPNAKQTIEQLTNYYNITNDKSLYDGNPLFREKLKGFEHREEKKLLMTIILDAYNRIFTRMQNETQDETVQRNLNKVKEYLNKLKTHYFSDKHNLKSYATDVMALKESDTQVQRKALFELMSVYNEAAQLGDSAAQNHRRRRQTKGPRKHRSKP